MVYINAQFSVIYHFQSGILTLTIKNLEYNMPLMGIYSMSDRITLPELPYGDGITEI
jgi:hypothetical protein